MIFNFRYKRKQIYWLSQVSGWTLFLLVNLFFLISFQKYDFKIMLVQAYLSLLGLGFTHAVRLLILRYHWVKLQIKQILPRIFIASAIMSTVIVSIVFVMIHLIHLYPVEKLNFPMFVANVFNIILIILIWFLIYFSIHYLENYKTSEIERLVWEAAVKDFELKTLKSQLNPHFMFNALNSIRALIEENPERAKTTITQLSNIFRYSLRIERTETVPLEDEMKTVRDYLALEQVRYEERLTYSIDIQEQAGRIEIPPMMIQTLVENGIKHGIGKLPAGGYVSIKVSVENNILSIRIQNSGTFSEEELQNSGGFGISNTKQRLHLLYGNNADFKIYEENKTVIVSISIPVGGN